MIAQEILSRESLSQLTTALSDQPTWSHIPIITMLDRGELATSNEQWLQILEPLGMVTLLERPASDKAVQSIVRAALSYRRRQYEVRDLLAQLEKSNRSKSNFLANMSHEIRTPLCAVLGFAELLMEPEILSSEREIYMETIRRNGRALSSLIDDILDLTQVESGKFALDKQEFSLQEMFSEVIPVLKAEAGEKGLAFDFYRADEFLGQVRADRCRLKQILLNIGRNAIKFTSRGQVAVRVLGQMSQGHLQIQIEDSGIGISQSQAEALFQPFTQADSSSTRNFGGIGLGLGLSRKLARAMDGDLRLLTSTPGGGSCFEISIHLDSLPVSAERIAY